MVPLKQTWLLQTVYSPIYLPTLTLTCRARSTRAGAWLVDTADQRVDRTAAVVSGALVDVGAHKPVADVT